MFSSRFSARLIATSCAGLLLMGTVSLLAGCGGGASQETKKEEAPVKMAISQIDQVLHIGDKIADGQYWVIRGSMENTSTKSLVLQPTEFFLQNITDKPEEQFSQPAEKFMTQEFQKDFGKHLKDKLMDFNPTNLYPRLQVERYFVFMVPVDAKPDEYQLLYKGNQLTVTAPLVTPETLINDRRNDTAAR